MRDTGRRRRASMENARATSLRQEPMAGNSAACASCRAHSRQDGTISPANYLQVYRQVHVMFVTIILLS